MRDPDRHPDRFEHFGITTVEAMSAGAVPIVIVPPWINKYYILDLREKNSMVKWATEQGHTTFIMSWINPDEKLAKKSFENYLLEGSLEAINQLDKTGSVEQALKVNNSIFGRLMRTKDFKEGVTAFAEKRSPNWTGN